MVLQVAEPSMLDVMTLLKFMTWQDNWPSTLNYQQKLLHVQTIMQIGMYQILKGHDPLD